MAFAVKGAPFVVAAILLHVAIHFLVEEAKEAFDNSMTEFKEGMNHLLDIFSYNFSVIRPTNWDWDSLKWSILGKYWI